MKMKTCTNCKLEKLYTEFYRRKAMKDGYNSWCKECHKRIAKVWQVVNRDRLREIDRKHYDTHRERHAELSKRYYDKADPQLRLKRHREYVARTRDERNAYSRRYAKSIRPRKKEIQARNRAKRNCVVVNDFRVEEWYELLDLYHNECFYCSMSGKLEADHVIPLTKHGDHTKSNIVPACRRCNAQKNNKTLDEYCLYLMETNQW